MRMTFMVIALIGSAGCAARPSAEPLAADHPASPAAPEAAYAPPPELDAPGPAAAQAAAPAAAPAASRPMAEVYTCPMHPQARSDKPGECPFCGMTLEKAVGR